MKRKWTWSLFCCSMLLSSLLFSPLLVASPAIDALSNEDATAGLQQALAQGAEVAVAQLGKPGGYASNPRVRIPLPASLEKGRPVLSRLGMDPQMEQLEQTMNKAAEAAVVEARPVLVNAVKQMSLADAKAVLTGNETAATDYFRRTTSEDLAARFLPIVKKHTDKLGIAQQYSLMAKPLASLGMMSQSQTSLDGYITQKALDGLFLMVADEEKAIRRDPMRQSSEMMKKVFGALRK